MSQAIDYQHIVPGVVAHLVYGGLIWIVKQINKKLEQAHPGVKKLLLSLTVLSTLATNGCCSG